MRKLLTKKKNRGQGMVEYGLILACVALACVGAMTMLGWQVEHVLWRTALQTIWSVIAAIIGADPNSFNTF